MEAPESHPEGCFHRTFSALTVDDVYEIAKLIGADVERLIDGCGKESVAGLVPKIVKVLELLENFTSRNQAHELREEELLKTFESLQLRKRKTTTRAGGENDEGDDKHEIQVRDAFQARCGVDCYRVGWTLIDSWGRGAVRHGRCQRYPGTLPTLPRDVANVTPGRCLRYPGTLPTFSPLTSPKCVASEN